MSGQRREFEVMIPFSTEKESTGRPAMFHARILTGSPRVTVTEKDLEQGIFFSVQRECHSCTHSVRNSTVKAPRYATSPEDTSTSPITLVYLERKGGGGEEGGREGGKGRGEGRRE